MASLAGHVANSSSPRKRSPSKSPTKKKPSSIFAVNIGTAQKFQSGNIVAAFGHAPSTVTGDKCAQDLYLAFRAIHGLRPDPFNPSSTEFDGEKLQIHFTVFASFLSTNIIPHRLDHSKLPHLISTNPNNSNYVGFKTICVYFGKVKEIFRRSISHEDLPKSGAKKDLDPDWYGPLLAGLTKKLVAFHLKMSCKENVELGNDKCLPLYRDLNVPHSQTAKDVGRSHLITEDDWWVTSSTANSAGVGDCTQRATFDRVIDSIVQKTDYVRCTTGMEDRFKLVMARSSVARGGEIKFNTVDEWRFDPLYQTLDTTWVESKVQKERYSCAHVNDARSCLVDFYHALGCYMMMEGGLHYTEAQQKDGFGNCVFPGLQSLSNDSVTSHLTDLIRKNLPANCSSSAYSAKSLRKATVSELSQHPQSTLFMVIGRSGHSSNNNVDSYLDHASIERSLPGGKILAGHLDVHKMVFPPRLESLGNHNKQMMMDLMTAAIEQKGLHPYFRPDGHLFQVTKVVFATLLMHHEGIVDHYGIQHPIAQHLIKAAERIMPRDPTFLKNPAAVLCRWSATVRKSWVKDNAAASTTHKDDLAATKHLLQLQTVQLQQISGVLGNLKEVIDEKTADMIKMEERHEAAQKLAQEQQQLAADQIHRLALKCVHLKTPDACNNKKRIFEEVQTTPQKNLCSSFASVTKSVDCSSTISTKSSSLSAPPDPMDPNYKFGDCASIVKARTTQANTEGTMKGISTVVMLRQFHKKHLFLGAAQDKANQIGIFPPYSSSKFLSRNVLELVAYSMSKEDWSILCGQPSQQDPEAMSALFVQAERNAMKQMLAFEARPEDNPKDKKIAGRKLEPYVTGLGKRVNEYKKWIKQRLGLDAKDTSTIPLQERSVVLAKAPIGTPPGNHSVARMFAARKEKDAALKAQQDTWKAACHVDDSPEATAADKEEAWTTAEEAFRVAMAAETAAARAEEEALALDLDGSIVDLDMECDDDDE